MTDLLTDAQVAQFDRDGYLVLKHRIDPDLLATTAGSLGPLDG